MKLKTYTVQVSEQVFYTFKIKANSQEEAEDKAYKLTPTRKHVTGSNGFRVDGIYEE